MAAGPYQTDQKYVCDGQCKHVWKKALHLIQQARIVEEEEMRGQKANRKNPYEKPWGLQKDGDLWELAWEAILKRGRENQRLR